MEKYVGVKCVYLTDPSLEKQLEALSSSSPSSSKHEEVPAAARLFDFFLKNSLI